MTSKKKLIIYKSEIKKYVISWAASLFHEYRFKMMAALFYSDVAELVNAAHMSACQTKGLALDVSIAQSKTKQSK